ncbi:MAG: T9SS type A sorting domain-containing protein [candidate division KSB1 bacterium]|nr:T9SS type A sorting domain-containing protein [candidate division KSB1 bacterium]
MIITGQMEYEGAGTGDSYVGLRYALTLQADTLKNPLEGTLENQYTDSAKWVAENAVHYGYEFTPVSGATVMANGAGGGGTTWIINGGGGWNSTWSNNGYPIAAVAPAPRRASITEGVYDWAISVQPLGDGTNEIRWYMVKEDTSYWFGGTTIDTAQVTTRFNTINFGIGDDLPAELTAFNVRDVKVDRGDPITVPAPPWEAFYLADWGFIGDRFGGWTLTPGELDGNVTISGEEAPSDWAAVRGGFGLDVMPTEEDALVIEGSVEFAGGGFEDWSSFRFGMFYSDSAGTIDSTETNGYAWNGTEDHHSGYLFLPLSGDAAPVDWQGIGETGTYGAVVDRPWMSTNGANDYVLGSTMPVPAGAVAGAGTYNFELSVQPIEGGMDVRFKLVKDDESYFFQDIATDTHDPVATEKFNCVAFAINNSTTTAMNITDVRVDMGDPIEVPVSVESDEQAELPQEYALNQNYPNPFNPSTTIEFALPKSGKVNLVVYDIMGRTVANLVQDSMEAGHHKITFDASKLTSGVYFYKLSAGDFTETKKFMLLK